MWEKPGCFRSFGRSQHGDPLVQNTAKATRTHNQHSNIKAQNKLETFWRKDAVSLVFVLCHTGYSNWARSGATYSWCKLPFTFRWTGAHLPERQVLHRVHREEDRPLEDHHPGTVVRIHLHLAMTYIVDGIHFVVLNYPRVWIKKMERGMLCFILFCIHVRLIISLRWQQKSCWNNEFSQTFILLMYAP